MKPNPRDYDTPEDYDDAMNDYIAYMETMYDRIDMEIEKIKEDKLDERKTTTSQPVMVSFTCYKDEPR